MTLTRLLLVVGSQAEEFNQKTRVNVLSCAFDFCSFCCSGDFTLRVEDNLGKFS